MCALLPIIGNLWVKMVEGSTAVEISARRRNRPEEVFARARLEAEGGEWARHESRLDLPAGRLSPREPADFVIALPEDSSVLIDQVFLFPRDHIEGMDPEMIALGTKPMPDGSASRVCVPGAT